jgi:hypothetical protein
MVSRQIGTPCTALSGTHLACMGASDSARQSREELLRAVDTVGSSTSTVRKELGK